MRQFAGQIRTPPAVRIPNARVICGAIVGIVAGALISAASGCGPGSQSTSLTPAEGHSAAAASSAATASSDTATSSAAAASSDTAASSALPSTVRPGPAMAPGMGPGSAALAEAGSRAVNPADAADGGDSASAAATLFEEVGLAAGIRFRHVSGNSPQKPFPAANGSGLATFDFDGDGLYDLFFCTGTAFPLAEPSRRARCHLYRNTDNTSGAGVTGHSVTGAHSSGELAAWRFADVSLAAAADIEGFCAGVAAGDYDNDGFTDLFITRFGPNVLLRNQGDGTFQRVEVAAGVADPRWATSAAFFDADEDGLLDLYVCNYAQWTWESNPYCGDKTRGIRMHCGPNSIAGERDLFYRNVGDGTFQEQLDEAGMGGVAYRGQGVVAGDLDDDGHVDLYVGNDLHPNLVFMGDGRGRFRDATETSGAAYDANGAAQASMGVDMADITGDGLPELFTTNFQLEYNALYENLGRGLFLDASARFGLVADSLVHVGWGTQFADFDLDGRLDLIVVNGHVDDNRHEIGENSPYAQPVLLYRYDGRRFERVRPRVAGPFFQQPHCARGLAVCDLDNDGDWDVVFQRQDERPAVLRNKTAERQWLNERAGSNAWPSSSSPPSVSSHSLPQATRDRRSLTIRLVGTSSNRDAIGARVTCRGPSGTVVRQVLGGGSYLSAPDRRLVVATAYATESVVVRWPSGRVSELRLTEADSGRERVVIEPPDSK